MAEQETGNSKPPGGFRLIAWMAGVLVILLLAIIIATSIGEADTRKALLDKILDWPVLGFSVAMMLFGALGREVLELVRTRNIKVGNFLEVGDKINAVEAETDEMGASLADRITALEVAVFTDQDADRRSFLDQFITHRVTDPSDPHSAPTSPASPSPAPPSPVPGPRPAPEEKSAFETPPPAGDSDARATDIEMFGRLTRSLANSRFEWRSLERLAIENGLTEDDVMRLFREYGQGIVRMGKGKSGKRIAKLENR